MSVKEATVTERPDVKTYGRSRRLMIPASDLHIDYSYQRPPNERRVRRIVTGYDPDALGIIYVNEREDGSFWIMDGQRRTLATVRVRGGEFRLACEVWKVDYQKEQQLFHRFNALREVMKAGYEARASFGAGDKDMVEIVRSLDEMGITHRWVGAIGKEPVVCCWGTLRAIYARYGLARLRQALKTVTAAWPGEYKALQSYVLLAAARFLSLHDEETDEKKIAEKWARTPIATVALNADTTARMRRQSYELALYRELVEAYNYNTKMGYRLQAKA